MLRPRRITKPAFPIPGAKVCDECERPKKIKRNHAGKSYCDACYKRGFTHMPCAGCGEACVAKRGTVIPYCRSCEAKQRLCKGCGEPVPHAGMIHEGEVVCPSCVPKYKEKEPCEECGEPSSRLSRRGGVGKRMCPKCRNGIDHITCSVCGRYRKGTEQACNGPPICVECVDGASHDCPDCAKEVAGSGRSRCRDCAARARGRAAMLAHLPGLDPWVRFVFAEYCEADLLVMPRGDVVKRITRAHSFFSTLGTRVGAASDVSAGTLLGAFGPEGLRRASKPVRFLVTYLGIDWPERISDDFAERARIDAMLIEIAGRPWAPDIASFLDHLRSSERARPLRPQSVRMYLRAAIALMERSGRQSAAEIVDGDVRALMRRSGGHANSLAAFAAWRGSLSAPVYSSQNDPKRREKELLRDGNAIIAALQQARTRSEALALLAAGIAKLHGIPLKTVLNLRGTDITAGRVSLPTTAFALAAPLAVSFDRWKETMPTDFVFKSKRTGQAMSTSGVMHHVRSLTIQPNKR